MANSTPSLTGADSRIEKSVFLSYRRTSSAHARLIYETLKKRRYDVFMDVESIKSGAWQQVILNQIASRAHFVLILTPSTLERCINPNDILRLEIEHAIMLGRNIVPLTFDLFDYKQHAAPYLTGDLALLGDYNMLDVPHQYFDAAMDRLHRDRLQVALDVVLLPISSMDKELIEQQAPVSAPSTAQLEAERLFEEGFAAEERSDYDHAVTCYSRALERDSQFADAYYRRGYARLDKGDRDAALDDWREGVRQLPSNEGRRSIMRSLINLVEQDIDGALREAESAVSANPKSHDAYVARSLARMNSCDFDGALADATEAIRLEPSRASAYNIRGNVHMMKYELQSAEADYTSALRISDRFAYAYTNRAQVHLWRGDLTAAERDVNRAMAMNPLFSYSFFVRGLLLAAKNECNEAISAFDEAIRLNPQMIDAYGQRALMRVNLGEFDAALSDANAAFEVIPDHAQAYLNRGHVHLSEGDYDAAVSDYTSALRVNRWLSASYVARGQAHCNEGAFDQAMHDVEQALKLNPYDLHGYILRGDIRRFTGDFDQAWADYNAALRLLPEYPDGYSLRALTHLERGNFAAALEDANRAVKIQPSLATSYVRRAQVHLYMGNLDDALKDAKHAQSLNGLIVDAYSIIGHVASQRGEVQNALEEYSKLIEVVPNFAAGYVWRGAIYLDLKQYDKARHDYDQALAIYPTADTYLQRAILNYRNGEPDAALRDCASALSYDPRLAMAHYYRGLIHMNREQYREGYAALNEAIASEPKYALAYHARGMARFYTNDNNGAIADLQMAVSLEPENQSFRDDLAHVKDESNPLNRFMRWLTS